MVLESKTVADPVGHVLFQVKLTDDKGSVCERTLTEEQYFDLLGHSMRHEESYAHVGARFLPPTTIDAYVCDERTYRIAWFVNGKKRCFFYGEGHYEIPFPALVFVLDVNKGCVRQKSVYAVKRGDDQLYMYPFGNVSESGGICMGNIHVDFSNGPEVFAEEFFLGKTNDDYYSPGNHTVPKWSQSKLVENLEKLDTFPDEWLLPTKGNCKTLDELKKSLAPQMFK